MFHQDTVVDTLYFQFKKLYRTIGDIAYHIDPILKEKTVRDGLLIGMKEPGDTNRHEVMFMNEEINYQTKSVIQIERPVVVSSQVYWSEKPKIVFLIVPPHLQHYQRHPLLIIKQIADALLADSYVTKENRKPIIGLRMLLEEMGNIRNGENGIENLDGLASIALGQDLQMTFVLQSFQQLRSLYGEAIENIVRANTNNIIFLKSNDKELIDELVRLSGVRHELRLKGKSSQRKVSDFITVGEPGINYSADDMETTALTSNDLMFLANKVPGNMIALPSNEMPIVNTLANIMPMAAGLHRWLPQARFNKESNLSIPYSDKTLPVTNAKDSINYLDNVINGEAMVREFVEHAKHVSTVSDTILTTRDEHNFNINERNGELASLVMPILYARYDRMIGQSHFDNQFADYYTLAKDLQQLRLLVVNKENDMSDRLTALSKMKSLLIKCIMDDKLSEYTAVYRDHKTNDVLGYTMRYVSDFIDRMVADFGQAPEKLEYDVQDVHAIAATNPEYTGYNDVTKSVGFIFNELSYTEAFEAVIAAIIGGDVELRNGLTKHDVDKDRCVISVDGVDIADVTFNGVDNITYSLGSPEPNINKAINNNPYVLGVIEEYRGF